MGIVPKKNKSNRNLRTAEDTKNLDNISKPNFLVVPIKNSCKVVLEQIEAWKLIRYS